MPTVSKRLRAAASEIGNVKLLADIGTDHGKLVIYALEHGLAERAFAVDISENSLEKAKRYAEHRNLADKIEFLCGDGLKPLPTTPEVVVIAGMGGNEIVKILTEKRLEAKYVLLPHQDAHILRKFLLKERFNITKDYVVRDGKFYTVLVAENGECNYSEREIILGKNYPPTEAFEDRLLDRKKKIEEILSERKVDIDNLQEEIKTEYKEICEWLKLRT